MHYGQAGDVPLVLDIIAPAASTKLRPAVIWVHGGGWTAGDRSDGFNALFCPLLAQHGFFTVTIEYRLMPHARFPAQIHDVKAAIRWLRATAPSYAIDPERIGIWGFSAGGHLAALAALTADLPELEGTCGSAGYSSRVHAVAVGAAPIDFLDCTRPQRAFLADFLGGAAEDYPDVWRLASPLYHVHEAAPPFLIAHSTLDETIPFTHAERFVAALRAHHVPVEFVAIEGVYHNWTTQMEVPDGEEREQDLGPLALPFFQRHLCP